MKRIKIFIVTTALLLGVGSAFAFADDPLCYTSFVGYSQPIDMPQFVIPGLYSSNYTCNLTFPTELCRWVKKADGTFTPCYGRLVRID